MSARTLCRALLLAGIAGLGAPAIDAQQARTPGPTARPDPVAAVAAMLRSSDAREQAWGHGTPGAIAFAGLFRSFARYWRRDFYDRSTAGAAALDIVLDGLIEMRQPPPAGMISMIFDRRPVQALILASSADGDEALDGFLFQVLRETTHDHP